MDNPAELVALNTTWPDGLLPAEAPSAPVAAFVAPALDVAEPISLDRAKSHLKVVGTDDDAEILALIVTARQMAEGRLNRTIVQRRRTARFAGWGERMLLLKPPIISVDSVTYVDPDGAEVEVDTAEYYPGAEEGNGMPRVELNLTEWPLVGRRREPIAVNYTAGYPVGEVPMPIIQWMLLAIGTMYANREMEVIGASVASLPDDFGKYLLQPYMVYE